MQKKSDLPTKICRTCQRPFTWRKKWARDWSEVLYCSERCRRARGAVEGAATAGAGRDGPALGRPEGR